MNQYKPIDCDLHSEYEAMCMQKSHISIIFLDASENKIALSGTATDVFAKNKAEYLLLTTNQQKFPIRLDRIIKTNKD